MIFAANFKTNHTRTSTKEYILKLENLVKNSSDEFYIFPPTSALQSSFGKVIIGTQNAYPTKNGAFTGEIGLEQLEEFSIKTILIGHSERRTILGESQEFIAQKFDFFKNNGFKIIYCIGEPLEVRESGESKVIEFLAEQFNGIDINYENLIIAYEPIWAIGTGVSATNIQIASTHKAVKQICNQPLLYGGSVNSSNIKEVLSTANVDGVLVGSASLEVENFHTLFN
ncbi:MAG: triose-phosphate isomerase [Sulfurovaceae bacterium]|nr:triose-phosphate isomerase [Sulfurovaceae bacterium]MDD5549291.1 triose-phosphate isomerase [Sulfurovaceae bacterium]